MINQRDLALAYSPGVAFACEAIVEDPANAFRYTARGNLVAVVTNGTAVLGLGDIGPLASKPVMEGKAVLFKKFAGIDVFDLEINEKNLDKLVDVIAALEPTFGGINLEDIKAPDCFYVERKLRERMKIPVFHDDQHGTAIVVGAALLNALKVVGKNIGEIKLVTSGAGAAALACLGLLVKLGVKRENIWVTDLAGVVYQGRTELMDEDKIIYAQPTSARKLAEVVEGADVFLGLSAAGVLKPEMLVKMAKQPLIFALANPTPEINPARLVFQFSIPLMLVLSKPVLPANMAFILTTLEIPGSQIVEFVVPLRYFGKKGAHVRPRDVSQSPMGTSSAELGRGLLAAFLDLGLKIGIGQHHGLVLLSSSHTSWRG